MPAIDPFYPLLFLTSVFSAGTAGVVMLFRNRASVNVFGGLFMLAMALVLASYTLVITSPTPADAQIWFRGQVLAYLVLLTSWSLFLFAFTGHSRWIGRWQVIALFSIPLAVTAIMSQQPAIDPVLTGRGAVTVGSMAILLRDQELVGTLFIAYAFGIGGLSIALLVRMLPRSGVYQWQLSLGLVVAVALTVIGGVVEVTGLNPVAPISFLQVTYAGASMISLGLVLIFRLGDVLPIARKAVFEYVSDAVFVLDNQDRVVDLNPAAQRLIGASANDVTGRHLGLVWPPGAGLLTGSATETIGTEQTVTVDGVSSTFDVISSSLTDASFQHTGRALVLRNVTGRERIERALQEQAQELARANRLVTALSMVAARMGSTSDPAAILEALGSEMRQLGLNCAVVSIDPAGSAATVKYLSYKPETIEALSELIGMTVIGHTIPRRLWPGDRVFHETGPIWLPQPRTYFRHMFPHLPNAVATRAGQWLGIGEEGHICLLPLRVGESVIGAMPIWGKDLRQADGAALAVFASQVAGILNRADAFEAEARRADELARSNGMILALSKVAARLDSTAPFKEVVDTFGRELKSLGIDCVVGTFDDDKEILSVQYMSISEDVIRAGERLTGLTLSQLTIPRERWPTDKVVTERLPYWDPQAMRGTLRMLPMLPEPIHRMLMRAAGVNLDDPTCYLPLAIDEDVIGVLSVWGSTLRQNDLPALSVFASQLATAIKNTRLLQQAQERLEERTALLNEKEVLLKEVHHRVKNNLQVISSLMNLQSAQVDDPRLKDALRESQNRVRTMALIHEKLYQTTDLAQIDIAGYLHTLVNFLSQSYRERASTVVARVEAENIKVDIETAIPCGLIVNELVSNALKHAFPDGRSGEIRVCVTHSPGGQMSLSVSDNGVGFPVGLDHTRSPSLGLNLVNTLIAQIGGTLSLERTPGTCFSITFNGTHA